MKTYDIDRKLREIGKEPLPEVPEIVRRRQDEVYASLADLPMHGRGGQTAGLRKTRRIALVAASAAAIALVGGIGGAMVSPAMADSLKNIPLIGSIFKLADDLGLRTADETGLAAHPDASVTHEGVTLRIPQLVYDGTRLSLAVTREGEGLVGGIMDSESTGNGMPAIFPKGAIHSFDVLIDGQPVHRTTGKREIGLSGKPTSDPNSALYELTAYSLTGEPGPILPDSFVLTAKIGLEGIEEPFVFELPVRKNTDQLAAAFNEAREWKGNIVTLERIEFTPITTKVGFNITSNDKEARLLRQHLNFELWDDRGRMLGLVGGFGFFDNDEQKQMINKLLFDRFVDAPKSVTLKAFLPEMEDPSASTGRYKVDSHGELIKKYVKELEITVPVDRAGLDKLYDISK
ncbi:DUF4179 domain-containing protein [Paenibacillus sp. JJ-223]|uniref:DUF4179 domain-containing protein n=1 Tax=Paenibacillus sp. JJ-223 TaxID=2905647 RepID=UPI001F16DDFE|nr:DUF4179 domain-containing protein [Paenibacillus sp. JJ-223]CAH1191408.1 hypothetical protein PAECIP111890_00445 [Paenibacillus sp. JJ-223]